MDGNVETNQTIYNLKGKIIALPTIDKTLLKSGYAADAKVTGDELAARVKTENIVDNLYTEDANVPLSANQGAVIKKQLDAINMSQAGTVGYSNTASGLSATNMQSAIDEVAASVVTVSGYVNTLASTVDANQDDYLSKNGGGMVNGPVQVRNADNGYGSITKNNSATDDYGTQLMDVRKDGKSAKLTVSAATGLLSYTDVDNNIRNLLHEGSKPFVEYTGNGNAASRTIATKGVGRLALVYGTTNVSLVTPKGAIVVDLTTGGISWIDSAKVFFANGNLVTGTSNEAFNKANEKYYCQVI